MKSAGILFSSVLFLGLIGLIKIGHSQAPLRNSHSTGTVESKFLQVKNVSFSRRYADAGRGEIMEVVFEVYNMVNKPLDLKFFVIGFHEKNNIDPIKRKRNGYPKWRVRDIDGEDLKIILLDSVPYIDKNQVDPDLIKGDEFAFPSFISYVKHLDRNAAGGIPFKLFSLGNVIQTKPIQKNDHQIVYAGYKTTITVVLFSKHKQGQESFNYVGIIVYDAQNKTAFRQFYHLKYGLKIW